MEFPNVTAHAKANLYFDGKVVSHAIVTASGEKKTMGVIFEGEYHFGTEAAERMEIIDGSCSVVIDGKEESTIHAAGEAFEIEANSGFTITVGSEGCQYVCTYL